MFKIRNLLQNYPLGVFFSLAFFIWIFTFRQFIFHHHWLVEDAAPYYQDISYFWRNLMMGQYPLWNPFFAEGSPNEFFLRRIGSFNPFFLLIPFFYTLGVPQFMSHNFFLSIYYFVGILGFYFLAKCVFNDKKIAFTAFLLLYFSALGTRLFDSYIVFPVIPMIWFFYFFCTFTVKPQRYQMLGMLFCLMIIFTTYIPFYFVTILLSFTACYGLVYNDQIKSIIKRIGEFLRRNKLFTALCLAIFMISLLPGIFLYRDAGAGQFVMPMRHSTLTTANALEVDKHWVEWWAILEDLIFSFHFLREIQEYEFAIFYIPLFAGLIFVLSLFTQISRRLVFLVLWGLLMFLIGTPHTPVYKFLSSKMFFFKYFRNLHFFLWMSLLPILILIVTEQLRNLLLWMERTPKKRIFLIFIGLFHFLVLFYFFRQHHDLISTYAVVVLSLLFFYLYQFAPKLINKYFYGLVLALVVVHPIEVYGYLKKNVVPQLDYAGEGNKHYEFEYFEKIDQEEVAKTAEALGIAYRPLKPGEIGQKTIYYGLPWYSFLYANVNGNIYEEYINYSIYFYDIVRRVEDKDLNIKEMEWVFYNRANVAFVNGDYDGPASYGDPKTFSPQAGVLPADTDEFKVVRFNANEVQFKTNLKQPKFVVYNDNFDNRWHGTLDGKSLPIYRANISFKGFWVPTGEHLVHLRYQSLGKHVFNFAMLALFYGVFFWLIRSSLRRKRS